MNFLAHLHLAHSRKARFPAIYWLISYAEILKKFSARRRGWHSYASTYRRITDNLPEVREAREWFRSETRRLRLLRWMSCGITFFPATGRSVAGLSATGICLLCPRASDDVLPDSPPRFINLNNYLWSEQGWCAIAIWISSRTC